MVQLKRRSLTDQLTLWLEDFFEMMLRKGEKMVEKMPVDRAEQRAIKSSMQSISNRVSGWSSRISKGIAESWAAFVTFAVLPLLPLDHMPQPLSGLLLINLKISLKQNVWVAEWLALLTSILGDPSTIPA